MRDLTYSITDYSCDPSEEVADGLSRPEMIRRLLKAEHPPYFFQVTCWDESTTEEDGTHPILWQKRAEEVLDEIFEAPVEAIPAKKAEVAILEAAKEALQCIPDLQFPPGAPEGDDPMYEGLRDASRYTEAVRTRLEVAIEEVEAYRDTFR